MLSAVLRAVQRAGRPMCLADLSRDLGIDEPLLEGMLDTLVARGRLRTIEFSDDGCTACPVKSGCFIMNDGVAKTYALPPDRETASRALPTFG